jgi:hypothetical protein
MGSVPSQPEDLTAQAPKEPSNAYWWRATRLLQAETARPADASDLTPAQAKKEVVRLRALMRDSKAKMAEATQESNTLYGRLYTRHHSIENVLKGVRKRMVGVDQFIEARKRFRTEERGLAKMVQRWERGEVTGHEIKQTYEKRGRGFKACSPENKESVFTRFAENTALPDDVLFEGRMCFSKKCLIISKCVVLLKPIL